MTTYNAPTGKYVDVMEYGALVDGVTDDTACWNQALSDVNSMGGGTVTCLTRGVSMVANILMPDNTTLEIPEGLTLMTLPGSSSDRIIKNSDQTNGNSNLTITGDGTLDGNMTNASGGDGIWFVKVSNANISVSNITNCYANGIRADQCDGIQINTNSSNNGHAGGGGKGIYLTTCDSARVIAVTNNNDGEGTYLGTAITNSLLDIICKSNSGTGLYVGGSCSGNTISAATIGNAFSGVACTDADNSLFVVNSTGNNTSSAGYVDVAFFGTSSNNSIMGLWGTFSSANTTNRYAPVMKEASETSQAGGTLAVDTTNYSFIPVHNTSTSTALTLTASGNPVGGQQLSIRCKIDYLGAAKASVAFGTGFKASGSVVPSAATKAIIVNFVYSTTDSAWNESGRSAEFTF